MLDVSPAEIPDVLLIQPKVIGDGRGFFLESYEKNKYAAAGLTAEFIQDNHSGSNQGTLRGLHYQIQHPQGKLVSVVRGEVFDVAIDLRRSSATFGQNVSVILSSEKMNQIYIPPGFAHGFYVLSDWADLIYKATDKYAPKWERTLQWNDPTLGIDWPLVNGGELLISEKDLAGKSLSELETFD